MSLKKNKPSHQPQLPLAQAARWHQLPEAIRGRCRHILVQLLHRVVLNLPLERSDDERKD